MTDLLFAFLEMVFGALFHAALGNRLTGRSDRFFVKILIVICGYAVLREALPFDEETSSYWSVIITISLVAAYYLFQALRRHIQQQNGDLYSPSNSPENIN